PVDSLDVAHACPTLRTPDSRTGFFFTDRPPTALSTLSLHDALPIYSRTLVRLSQYGSSLRFGAFGSVPVTMSPSSLLSHRPSMLDRKSTRLNSSHVSISYAVFCLKKKSESSCSRKTCTSSPPRGRRR